jgi:K+-transporting ATPase KdpF subunit
VNGDNAVGLVIVIFIAAYLVFALLAPERL